MTQRKDPTIRELRELIASMQEMPVEKAYRALCAVIGQPKKGAFGRDPYRAELILTVKEWPCHEDCAAAAGVPLGRLRAAMYHARASTACVADVLAKVQAGRAEGLKQTKRAVAVARRGAIITQLADAATVLFPTRDITVMHDGRALHRSPGLDDVVEPDPGCSTRIKAGNATVSRRLGTWVGDARLGRVAQAVLPNKEN
jgi:hypothetical protein